MTGRISTHWTWALANQWVELFTPSRWNWVSFDLLRLSVERGWTVYVSLLGINLTLSSAYNLDWKGAPDAGSDDR